MAFKISKENKQELQKAVNNFNAKIKRLESVDKEIDIPTKENIKAIMDRVNSKWDLNREIDRLERFTKRNAEELLQNKSGVVMSRWEFENIQKEQRRLRDKLTREIESYSKIKPTEFGVSSDFTYAQMGDERLSNLKARREAIKRRNISKINREQLKELETILKKTAAIYRRDKNVFYDSYLDGTILRLAYQTGYEEWKAQYIRKKLKELSETQFIKAFNKEAALKDLQDKYLMLHEEGIIVDDLSDNINNVLEEVFKNIDQIVEDYK